MKTKRSPVWQYFDECVLDAKHAKCKICKTLVSRGSDIPRKRTPKPLELHLERNHEKEYNIIVKLKKQSKDSMDKVISSMNGSNVAGSSSMNGSNVAGTSSMSGETKIANLRTKKERNDAMSATIVDWIESKTKVNPNSAKAREFDKSVFELVIMDCLPFAIVNNLGFQRHHQKFLPNYEVKQQF